jgi:hypothetical protein
MLGVEDGDYHSFLPSTAGIRAIIYTIEMNEKGIRWLLARPRIALRKKHNSN